MADAVDQAVKKFGGIDMLVNNASAISLTPTTATPMKRYDLMHQVNIRGTFLCSQKCIPHLAKSDNGHILNLSPPLNMEAKWFAGHVAYTMSKFGMSMCVLGMAAELAEQGIAANALWPAHGDLDRGGRESIGPTRPPLLSQAGNHGRCRVRDPEQQ